LHLNSGRLWILAAMLGTAALGQTAPNSPAQDTSQTPAAAPAATPTPSPWTQKGIDFYVLGDVYGDLNFNHPSTGYNQLYNFDFRANQVHLNFAKFSMEKATGVVGFRLDVGAGQTVDWMASTDQAPEAMKYFEQVYLELRPTHMHGIQFDVGKFVTSAGAEVIETNNDWNYSRSLLFAWAIPYYHLGVRTTIPITKTFTAGVQLVNGWNNVKDNNDGKTVGLVGNFTWKKVSWFNNYYSGPEKNDTNTGFRQLYDTTVLLNPTDKFSAYLNYDFGTEKYIGPGRATWTGFAGAARYQLTKRFAIAPRAEIFADRDGFSTGTAQTVKEVTLTGEMKIRDGLISRLEFRHDQSDQPFFTRGGDIGVAHGQTTVALSLIAFFGPKK
jgi:hypothetical protein